MPDFRMQNNFPIADVINATQRKAQLDNEATLKQSELFNQSMQAIGTIGKSLHDKKVQVAQALALGKLSGVPDDLARVLTPEQVMAHAKVQKGYQDSNSFLAALRSLSGQPPPQPQAPAVPASPSLATPTPAASPEHQLGANMAAQVEGSPTVAPVMNGGLPPPTTGAMPVPGSVPVPIAAPPSKQMLSPATQRLLMQTAILNRPDKVMTEEAALKAGSAPHGTRLIKPASNTDQISWDNASAQQRSLAQAMYEGRVRPSDIGFRDRGKITLLANEYAGENGLPPFKAYSADVNATMAKFATSGKLGQNALSLNTALGHAASAFDSYKALEATNQAWLNTPINKLKKSTNDPNVVALGINLNALQGELANVFKNSGATDQEISHWKNYLNEDLTPDQYVGALSKIDDLLKSRLDAMEFQRSSASPGGSAPLISPHGKEISNKLSKGQNSQPTVTPKGTAYTVNP